MTTKLDDENTTQTSDEPEINIPGLGKLREAVANYADRWLPGKKTIRRDGIAGLTVAIANVPDGMASGLLAGVNPVYGLYASLVGPIVGGIFASTMLMVITNTNATALVAGQAITGLSGEDRDRAMFLLVMLSGVFQIVFGLLKLGRVTRFVSYSVMTGFLAGIAVILILSQLPTITGVEAEGGNRITQTFDLLTKLGDVHVGSLAIAVLSATVVIIIAQTRFGKFGALAAIVVTSILVLASGLEDVEIVEDVGDLSGGLPALYLPAISDLSVNVVSGAVSLAAVVLIQGAGVSQSVPNPDRSRRRLSRDFIAQGAANIAAGFIRGVPVGGSMGATALNVTSGARKRWSSILAGLWMAVIVIALPGLVSRVPMPALGAILIIAGVRSISPSEITGAWRAGWPARLAIVVTFFSTLILPIQIAVGIGVLLSALLYVVTASANVTLVEVVEHSDGRIEEREPPRELPGERVTVLTVYGHLFFAGARTLSEQLPRPGKEKHPVVILRLRGRQTISATLIEEVLTGYAEQLRSVDGRLYLSGISKPALDRILGNGRFRLSGPMRVYEATPIVGESTQKALEEAEAWLVDLKADEEPAAGSSGDAS